MLKVEGALTIERLPWLLNNRFDSSSRLDLKRCRWVDPVGLVTLGVLADHFGPAHLQAWVTPRDPEVARYLARMRVPAVLKTVGNMEADLTTTVREKNHAGYLCELRATASASPAGTIADIVLDRLGDADQSGIAQVLYECLAEAWGNVGEHSRAPVGYACAQVLERDSPRQRIVIGIADPGVGIAETLRGRVERPGDANAVLAAVNGLSSTGDPGRGTGLPTIMSGATTLGGKLLVISGDGGVSVQNGSITKIGIAERIPGTIIGVELPCGLGA